MYILKKGGVKNLYQVYFCLLFYEIHWEKYIFWKHYKKSQNVMKYNKKIITSLVMSVMYYIAITCNLKFDALHRTPHCFKKCYDCSSIPLHIIITPGLLKMQLADTTNKEVHVHIFFIINLIAILYDSFLFKTICV